MKAPLFVFRQLWKHQIGIDWTEDESFTGVGDIVLPSTSWNEASGRYVEFEPEFYIPDVIRYQSKDNKQGSEGNANEVVTDFSPFGMPVREYFEEACLQAYRAYKNMVALGLAKEQMRLLLPQNIYSECILTVSLQALLYLWEMRDKKDAQWESRQYAIASKELILPVFRGKLAIA
jgi:thymidylate synthase (FAD)